MFNFLKEKENIDNFSKDVCDEINKNGYLLMKKYNYPVKLMSNCIFHKNHNTYSFYFRPAGYKGDNIYYCESYVVLAGGFEVIDKKTYDEKCEECLKSFKALKLGKVYYDSYCVHKLSNKFIIDGKWMVSFFRRYISENTCRLINGEMESMCYFDFLNSVANLNLEKEFFSHITYEDPDFDWKNDPWIRNEELASFSTKS